MVSKDKQVTTTGIQNKIIPLKQLKELIEDIYVQKEKYDVKCHESMLRIETMEQFMYTYLN